MCVTWTVPDTTNVNVITLKIPEALQYSVSYICIVAGGLRGREILR